MSLRFLSFLAICSVFVLGGEVVHAQEKKSPTPDQRLIAACMKSDTTPAQARAILKAGADVTGKDWQGSSALELARKNPALKGTKSLEELEAATTK